MKQQKRVILGKKIQCYENAVKLHCYGCMGGRKKVDCEIEECELYDLRPFSKLNVKKDSGNFREQIISNLNLYEG